MKEEKLVREKRRELKEKERQMRREWEKEVDRGKEKDDEVSEVRRGGRNGVESGDQRSWALIFRNLDLLEGSRDLPESAKTRPAYPLRTC